MCRRSGSASSHHSPLDLEQFGQPFAHLIHQFIQVHGVMRRLLVVAEINSGTPPLSCRANRWRTGSAACDNAWLMRPLRGVLSLTPDAVSSLKRHALLFDHFYVTDLDKELSWHLQDDVAASLNADLAFLQETELITWQPHKSATIKSTKDEMEAYMPHILSLSMEILDDVVAGSEDIYVISRPP
jgi:hypothetical protein